MTQAACSLVVSSSEPQCQATADCKARGFPDVAVCNAQHVCVDRTTIPCTTNAECQSILATPAICKQSSCFPLLTQECTKVFGPIEDQNAIFLGSIFSLTGVNAASGQARTNSVELAVS